MPSVNRDSAWMAEVGDRLRLFADRKGLEHRKLAADIGAKPARFANWLAGKSPVDIACAVVLRRKFGVPLEWLYMGELGQLTADLYAILYNEKQ